MPPPARHLANPTLRRAITQALQRLSTRPSPSTRAHASLQPERRTSTGPASDRDRDPAAKRDASGVETAPSADATAPDASEKPGAIGGFMRGLMGGQSVAMEDAFIAEAKQQGVPLPPPPPADLVPVKRRKRREQHAQSHSIRDRIFARFAGSAFMQGAVNAKERIAETIDESDNPVVNMFRNIYDRLFAENEMAMVVREIREEDPAFRISQFLALVEQQLIPTILRAYLSGDRDALQRECTQDAYAMLNASIRERDAEGIVMDTNILDVSDVELMAGRVLDDAPVLIVSFNTQQINCLRDRAGKVVEGSEDDIRAVYYAWAFVKQVEFEDVQPTGGALNDGESGEQQSKDAGVKQWKLMEMVIRGAHSTI